MKKIMIAAILLIGMCGSVCYGEDHLDGERWQRLNPHDKTVFSAGILSGYNSGIAKSIDNGNQIFDLFFRTVQEKEIRDIGVVLKETINNACIEDANVFNNLSTDTVVDVFNTIYRKPRFRRIKFDSAFGVVVLKVKGADKNTISKYLAQIEADSYK